MNKEVWPVAEWIDKSLSGHSILSIAKEYNTTFWMVSSRMRDAGFIPPVWNKPELALTDRAWIAAVIDCEGTLTIHTPWNKRRDSRNIMIFAKVDMTDDSIPLRLQSLCGGSFNPLQQRPFQKNPRAKPNCIWQLSSNGLRWLLPQIYPYLLIKRRHAEILTEVLTTNTRGRRSASVQMPFGRLNELITELRFLNQRGVKADLTKIRDRIAV
jgi:hypothetical protein